ncbi:MAG: exonuclease SbcCD subunit D C-terminal domain-containing protein [Thermonemataceae bacterium]|nr:exonuclease SbcCD subunit D C-terminal domain-containing protein [Thermonemataceae bacterium]
MKILHTADWHLGQRFHDKDRFEEHQSFLDWLLEVIVQENIDLLIVAGDIFDSGTPPSKSIEQYHTFLGNLFERQKCEVVIIGGNHDAPHTLSASKDVLKHLKVHIVGAAPNQIEEEIIEVKNGQELIGVVCAVPFLRDKDIHYSKVNFAQEARETCIVEGIVKHYQDLANILSTRNYPHQLPIIATGHLFVQGYSNEEYIQEAEKKIYMGNLGSVSVDAFPEIFDYVALGHLHRSQLLGKRKNIAYAGSPIPLSFSERSYAKSLNIVHFKGDKSLFIERLEVPSFIYKNLVRFEGSFEEVKRDIENYYPDKITWAEYRILLENPYPYVKEEIEAIIAQKENLEILRTSIVLRSDKKDDNNDEAINNIKELAPEDVFLSKCQKDGVPDEEIRTHLMPLFWQVLEELEETGNTNQ